MPVNETEDVVVGKDLLSGEGWEGYVKCGKGGCNGKMIGREEREDKYMWRCRDECGRSEGNVYVKEDNVCEEEVEERLGVIEEEEAM